MSKPPPDAKAIIKQLNGIRAASERVRPPVKYFAGNTTARAIIKLQRFVGIFFIKEIFFVSCVMRSTAPAAPVYVPRSCHVIRSMSLSFLSRIIT